jgi:EAL domain-containing protein (putative c-di-GMP-specific phosphodiesterase class I)
MPGMDGVGFIRHVARRGLASAVVIASGLDRTVLKGVEAVSQGYGLQVLGVAEKPITARRLEELLAAYVRPARAATQGEQRPTLTPERLAEALHDGRIVAHYEPIVDLATGRISGAAAVPRWQEPGVGWIAPASFLPLLESAELSVPFTDHMLELVCAQQAELARAGLYVELCLHIPTPSLGDVLLPDRVSELVAEHAADPRRIICAVGERSIRHDSPTTLDLLVRLRVKGIGLHFDGFRQGYGGAEQLARFPFTGVRLAPGQAAGAGGDARRVAALEESLGLVRELGLPAVSTGWRGRPSLRLRVAGLLGVLVAVLSVLAAVQLNAAHAGGRAPRRGARPRC